MAVLPALSILTGVGIAARTSDANSIINSTKPRTIRLVMKRDEYHDDDLKALQPKLATMEKAFKDMGQDHRWR